MKTIYYTRFLIPILLLLQLCSGCKVDNGNLILSFMEMKGWGPGWGLAIVIQTPEGHTYMYDTGSNYPNAGFDAGKDMIAPFLERNNIKEIDGVVISHSHNDHFGGFQYLMKNFKIKQLYDNGYPFPSGNPEYDSIYKPEFIKNGGLYKILKQGDTLNWDKHLEVVVLSPPKDYINDDPIRHTDHSTHHNPNLNSIVLRVRYKNNVFLFTGDINLLGQEYLIQKFGPEELKTTVLCAGHGGSFQIFADVIKPDIVVQSCLTGVDGPAKEAQKIYAPAGSYVYANCWNGTLQVVSDGNTCTVKTERNYSPYDLIYDKNLKQYKKINNN